MEDKYFSNKSVRPKIKTFLKEYYGLLEEFAKNSLLQQHARKNEDYGLVIVYSARASSCLEKCDLLVEKLDENDLIKGLSEMYKKK